MSISLRLPSGKLVSVDSTVAVIGKDPGCDVALPNETGLQPQHAKIRKMATRWMIESQGHWLVRVGTEPPGKTCWLQPGDTITLAPAGPSLVFQPSAALPEFEMPPENGEPADLGTTARLVVLRAEREALNAKILPLLYQELGRAVREDERVQRRFARRFGKVTKLIDQMAKLESDAADAENDGSPRPASMSHEELFARAKQLGLDANAVFADLGRAAYGEFGKDLGQLALTDQIAFCQDRVGILDQEIQELAGPWYRRLSLVQWLMIVGLTLLGAEGIYLAIASFGR